MARVNPRSLHWDRDREPGSATVIPSLRVMWVEFDGTGVVCDRAVQITLPAFGAPPIVIGIGISRLEFHARSIIRNGFVELADVSPDLTANVVGPGKLRIHIQCLVTISNSRIKVFLLITEVGSVSESTEVSGSQIGFCRE